MTIAFVSDGGLEILRSLWLEIGDDRPIATRSNSRLCPVYVNGIYRSAHWLAHSSSHCRQACTHYQYSSSPAINLAPNFANPSRRSSRASQHIASSTVRFGCRQTLSSYPSPLTYGSADHGSLQRTHLLDVLSPRRHFCASCRVFQSNSAEI
jgi:hypothetical protein